MRVCAVLTAVLVSSAALADDKDKGKDKPTVRAIPTKDLKVTAQRGGKVSEPASVTSEEELAKSPVVGPAADDLKKLIDFQKEKLLVFSWSGSGEDVVTLSIGAEGKDSIVYGEYIRGRTKDLRTHVRLFAVPKDLKVVIENGK